MSVRLQREAAEIREEWLGRALSTRPADRPATEAAIAALYGLIGLPPPRFHWVPSPLAALHTVPPGVRPRPAESVERLHEWPLPQRFSALTTRLSSELDLRLKSAAAMDRLFRQEIYWPLRRSISNSLLPAIHAAHDSFPRGSWYETQGVAWVAHYDGLRRTGGLVCTPGQARALDRWATLARSGGWWWPREHVCVVAERPVLVRTEAAGEGGARLHSAAGPALRYADGWDVYAWHGMRVPSWVITDPSVERIAREPNAEIRRCAIEHVGWAAYVERAGLRRLASAPDPGNHGSDLHLYDMGRRTRVLVAVNGSVERDGHRRRYGLTVPGFLDDPIAAAAWTYGLSAEQYSLLARRT